MLGSPSDGIDLLPRNDESRSDELVLLQRRVLVSWRVKGEGTRYDARSSGSKTGFRSRRHLPYSWFVVRARGGAPRERRARIGVGSEQKFAHTCRTVRPPASTHSMSTFISSTIHRIVSRSWGGGADFFFELESE